ncbi:hypothetical protein JCM14036_34010 [Desulfotomaculum defluvii]
MNKGALPISSGLKEERGLTLVELLITLAILSIVLAVGYLFNFYVNKSYTVSSNQSEVQFCVRMASESIENMVRGASEIMISQDVTSAEGKEVIYIEEGTMMHYQDGLPPKDILDGYSQDVNLSITFNKIENGILGYTISGKINEEHPYVMTKEVRTLKISEIVGNSGNSIVFKQ